MFKNTLRESMTIYIAMAFYPLLGMFLFSNFTVLSITVSLLLFAGVVGTYYKKKSALDSCLVILTIIPLYSLITLSPIDIDLSPDEIDDYMEGFNRQLAIIVIFYLLWIMYFYCLGAIRQYPVKYTVLVYIFFFFVTAMMIYLRYWH